MSLDSLLRAIIRHSPWSENSTQSSENKKLVFGSSERVGAWLRADNRYLGGLASVDALRAGRVGRVDAAAEALASGTFV